MKKTRVALVLVLVGLVSLTGLWYFNRSATAYEVPDILKNKKEKAYDQPAEAMEYFLYKRMDASDSQTYHRKLAEAQKLTAQIPVYSSRLDRVIQPGEAIRGGQATWESLGPGNIGGRTRALVINPQNPNHMVAGGVAGGTWVTMDGGANWTATGDIMANMAVVSLAMDSSDPMTILAGTGEGFGNGGAVVGAGIFKSTDGGMTWAQLASTNLFEYLFVNDLVASPNQAATFYAGTWFGIYRTTDGGDTWTNIHLSPERNGVMDIEIRTDLNTDALYWSSGNFERATIYRNMDALNSGTTEEIYSEADMGRTDIAISPSDQDVIYLCASDATGNSTVGIMQYGLLAVIRSDDGGDNWYDTHRVSFPLEGGDLILTNGPIFVCNGGSFANVGSQGWYDNIIAVDPTNSDIVWAGGIDLYRSDDGGQSWGIASLWYLNYAFTNYVHSDQHNLVFHPDYNGTTNRVLFSTNDGGVYRTLDAQAEVPAADATGLCPPIEQVPLEWQNLNNNYGVTQFYHGQPFPGGTVYFGGTQDNGTVLGTDETGSEWFEINGGDGGYVAVNPTNTNILYSENTRISIQKSTDGGLNWASATSGISDSGLFINPFLMDPNDPDRLWTGGNAIWRTDDAAGTWTQASTSLTGVNMSAFAVAPGNSDLVLVGTSNGLVRRTDAATTATDQTVWTESTVRAGAFISSVAFDPQDADIAYATSTRFGGNHVFRSTDGGQSWTSIDSNFPDIPAHRIVVHPTDSARLYLGSDLGVFVSSDTGATWSQENTGYANVVTEWLEFQQDDCGLVLFAFTHGRGSWRLPLTSLSLSASSESFTAAGGDSSFDITALANCAWTASTEEDWIRITAGDTGSSNGTVSFSVGPNTSSTARTGFIRVGTRAFAVEQEGDAACSYLLSAVSASYNADGNQGSFDVMPSPNTCSYEATTQYYWIQIQSGATGEGPGTVGYAIAANPSSLPRTGTIEVNGQAFSIVQEGAVVCTYALDVQSLAFSGEGGSGSIAVTTNSQACAWIATNQYDWISITSGQSGTGSGSVSIEVAFNTSSRSRAGSIRVAGRDVSIVQAPSPCDYALSAQSESFTYEVGEGAVTVTPSAENCPWTAETLFDWITITSGQAGTGSGSVTYMVDENALQSPRTGFITINDLSLTIEQGAAPPCDLTLSSEGATFDQAGGPASFDVTVNVQSCDWRVTTQYDWISIDGNSAFVGDGTVSYRVNANTEGNRLGTITIANNDETLTFTVTQGNCLPSTSLLAALPGWPTSSVLTLVPLAGCDGGAPTLTKTSSETKTQVGVQIEAEGRDR